MATHQTAYVYTIYSEDDDCRIKYTDAVERPVEMEICGSPVSGEYVSSP